MVTALVIKLPRHAIAATAHQNVPSPQMRSPAESCDCVSQGSPCPLPCLAAVLPFGITLLAPSWTDEYVAGIAAAYEKATGLQAGPLGHCVTPYRSQQAQQ